MLGAGSAGVGVCEQVVRSMVADGLSEREARARIYVVDIGGLLTTDRTDLDPAQRRLAQPPATVPSREPGSAPRPHRRDRRSASHRTHRPVHGRRRFHRRRRPPHGCAGETPDHHAAVQPDQPQRGPATGPRRLDRRPRAHRHRIPVPAHDGRRRQHPGRPVQQRLHLPGVGLGVTAVHATRITDAMLTAAAHAVAAAAPSHHDPHGMLLPGRAQLADTALLVAAAVAGAAVAAPRPRSPRTRSARPSTGRGGYLAIAKARKAGANRLPTLDIPGKSAIRLGTGSRSAPPYRRCRPPGHRG